MFCYYSGCATHLINLVAEKGGKSLPVTIDDLLVNIFCFVDKSVNWKHDLNEFQSLHDKEVQTIF